MIQIIIYTEEDQVQIHSWFISTNAQKGKENPLKTRLKRRKKEKKKDTAWARWKINAKDLIVIYITAE